MLDLLNHLTIDNARPWADQINTNGIPWHKLYFLLGKKAKATTRQFEGLTHVTLETITETSQMRDVEAPSDGVVQTFRATMTKDQVIPTNHILLEALRNANTPIIGAVVG